VKRIDNVLYVFCLYGKEIRLDKLHDKDASVNSSYNVTVV